MSIPTVQPGDHVTATFAPAYRPTYRVTGVVQEPDSFGCLTLGGWEAVQRVDGTRPGYVRAVEVHAEPLIIAEPGWHPTIPEGVYHAGPTPTESLSQSGAKELLRSPAHYRHKTDHGRAPRPEFDFGHVAHSLVLGEGLQVCEVHADSWRTKAAQAERDAARADGAVPILSADLRKAEAMAEVVAAHPTAGPLLRDGMPEVSLFDIDHATGEWIRGRVDYWADGALVDYKTTTDAAADTFNRKSVAGFGYYAQAAWYLDMAARLDMGSDRFIFVAQEKEPPYAVSVLDLDEDYLDLGRARNRRAIDIFHECRTSGQWPGYPQSITRLSPPAWMLRDHYSTLDPSIESDLLALLKG